MVQLSLILLAALIVVLIAAELFTNALEHLGQTLQISEGVTGSLLAAVGTALPETVIPVIAVFTGGPNASMGAEIGVGAILGAPLMLSTLTLSLMGLGAWRRDLGTTLKPEPGGLHRDLDHFLIAFVFAALALYVPERLHVVRLLISMLLCLLYAIYVASTLRASRVLVAAGHGTKSDTRLALARMGMGGGLASILFQIALSAGLLLGGAQGFIYGVEGIASQYGFSALLLSLLLIPIATELPEKINSLRWIRRGKDTLAFGNVTGAMVFQGTLLPAVGILLTPWTARREVLAGVLIALAGALWLRLIATRAGLNSALLAVNGLFYLVYLATQLWP